MTTTVQVTLDNFSEVTGGARFRVSKIQAARIALTDASEETRNQVTEANNIQEAAEILNAFGSSGKPLNWVEEAMNLLSNE